MNKILLFQTMLFSVLSPAAGLMPAQAQSGRYTGPPIDLERIWREPPSYKECAPPNIQSGREAAACNFGVEEARRMAMKYGGGHGRIEGFLRGFTWGLRQMSDTVSRDSWAISQGARAVDSMDYYLASAGQLGRQQGEAQGRAAGARLAEDRFLAAVDTGKFPSSQFVLPPASYAGEDNGYERFVDKNGAKTPQQILRDDLGHMNAHLRAYENLDRVFMGAPPELTLWDVWKADGIHHVNPQSWFDEDAALKIWFAKAFDVKARYDSLNDPLAKEAPTGKAAPQNERPFDYQKTFRSAFTKAYRHYVRFYYSRAFYQALDEGQVHGELAGVELGKKIAYQNGLITSFNARFKDDSRRAFQSAYENACRESFKTTFDSYAGSARLNIDSVRVIGMDDDGIIQPGERIAVSFRAANSGGQAAAIKASLDGDVTDPETSTPGVIPALTSRVFKTPVLAVINPQLRTGTTANLILKVNNIETPFTEKILTPIQITSYRNVLETTAGTARLYISLQNISTVRSPGEITVRLILPEKSQEKSLSVIDAGQVKETEITLAGMDPFALIKGIDSEIQVFMSGRFMSDTRSRLIPSDVKFELASYYDQLIKGRGLTPSNLKIEDRLTSVTKMIISENLADVKADTDNNPWEKSPPATILGFLVHNLASTDQTAAARKIYAQLGKKLWPHRQELGKVLFFKSGKRKAYERLCKELMQD